VTAVFQPPHRICRFRAYASLAEAAGKWLQRHQTIAKHDAGFLPSLNQGDCAKVAHSLKIAKYYTGPEPAYAAGMTRMKKEIDAQLGPAT
jgi:hypothetical protein